jgi:hypothetical protein
MAGGKETPRQKMIGMMYLVLTALLALNVSKEIITAFVTINDKLAVSGEIVQQGTRSSFGDFDAKRLGIQQQGNDPATLAAFEFWHDKAVRTQRRKYQIVHHILSESNEMIKMAEKQDWVENTWTDDKTGNEYITELKSLFDIKAMDNYDIPTNMFIGGNPRQPIARGLALRDSILAFRDYVTREMGTYSFGGQDFSFEAPADTSMLEEALQTVNPDGTDREAIRRVYNALSVPETITVRHGGRTIDMPWPSVMFDHAPIVAAAAMLTALKVDVLTAESQAIDFFLSKIDAPSFSFNKIQPLAFAQTSYINRGDSIGLQVMVAAFDSMKPMKLQYWINDSTRNPENVLKFESENPMDKLMLKNMPSGEHTIYGYTAVEIKGKEEWKPWDFNFAVGEPSGTVSLPDMRVLYRGYENVVEGAASGFPSYRLTASPNVRLTQRGQQYIAVPSSGNQAKISIMGVAQDGSTQNLGSFDFDVRPLPPPQISFGGATNGQKGSRSETRLFARYPEAITLKATFTITQWEMEFMGRTVRGQGNQISPEAQNLLRQAQSGATVTFLVDYRGPDGRVSKGAVTVKM